MSRSFEDISLDLEALMMEYHRKHQAENGEGSFTEDTLITGVDFITTFEIRVLDDSSSGGYQYTIGGNQSGTTSIGLAARTSAYVESTFLYPDEDS